ncbi:MAG TPA: sulfotransferase [Marmoricola sp.]|nr:sulfotransferase [Marmoricola sp.]
MGSLVRRTPPYQRLLEERNRLEQRYRWLQDECDQLAARAAAPTGRNDLGDDLGYVFIVTYGRSGSTLLLGLLDSTPGWLVRGENAGAVYHLYRHFKEITDRHQSRRREEPSDSTHPWFGLDEYPRQLALAEISRLIHDTLLRPEPDTRVTGFKEIRWQQPDLIDYLRFLQRLFPGARFVFNTRNHEDVVQSKWWAKGQNPLAEVARIETIQAAAAEALGDAAYRVHYDDYVHDPGALRGLFAWLGEEFDEERIRTVMSIQHSY